MNNINKQLCSGCGGCVEICPRKCICLLPDKEGFWKAQADERLCIDCGLCLKSCSMTFSPNSDVDRLAWAAYHESESVRNSSSSGGIFYALAEQVLQNGGSVCGAAFDDALNLSHILIKNIEDLPKLCGSKYLQSDIREVYSKIKQVLQMGETVLFVGTPCQVAGLYTAIGGRHEKLITCDLVCHGIPSPELFRGYLRYLEKRFHSTIVSFQFRSKQHANDRMSYTSKVGLKQRESVAYRYLNGDEDPYILRFISGALQAESCFTCPYATITRMGDITLADYWEYETAHPELKDKVGISLILANTNKGKQLVENLQNISLIPTDKSRYLPRNQHLSTPMKKHPQRDVLYKTFVAKGFSKAFYRRIFLPDHHRMFILKRRIKELLARHSCGD